MEKIIITENLLNFMESVSKDNYDKFIGTLF